MTAGSPVDKNNYKVNINVTCQENAPNIWRLRAQPPSNQCKLHVKYPWFPLLVQMSQVIATAVLADSSRISLLVLSCMAMPYLLMLRVNACLEILGHLGTNLWMKFTNATL